MLSEQLRGLAALPCPDHKPSEDFQADQQTSNSSVSSPGTAQVTCPLQYLDCQHTNLPSSLCNDSAM